MVGAVTLALRNEGGGLLRCDYVDRRSGAHCVRTVMGRTLAEALAHGLSWGWVTWEAYRHNGPAEVRHHCPDHKRLRSSGQGAKE